jgi:alkaline phosphatase D
MLDRRTLLRGAAAAAAMRFLAAGAAAAPVIRPRLSSDPFVLGVASGEPSRDGFVLWTRIMELESDSAPGFEIALDENFRKIVRKGRGFAPAARAGAVHLEVNGLPPGRPYFYRFHLGDAVSPIGKTITIAEKARRARLALTSCQHWEQGWFSAYADMMSHDIDAVLQVGDYIYEKSFGSGPDVRRFGSSEPHTLSDYRARYALYRTDPHLVAAHAAMPFIVTWDDHEVENDYAGDAGVETADPQRFLERRAAAYQAYFEHMPLRPSFLRAGGEVRLYRRLDWGNLATLHILDSRQYRTPHPCATAQVRGGQVVRNCPQAIDPSATMLGIDQEKWLSANLAGEKARWSLIVQQTLFSRLFLPGDGEPHYSDIWDGYVATRDRTISAIAQPAVRNGVVLGGDVHSFWLNDIKKDFDREASPTAATEIVTSCLASRNGPEALFGPAKSLNPHVRFLDNAHAGYALLDLTSDRMNIDMRAVADLTDPQSRCQSLGRYAIEDGRPGIAS